MTRPSLFASALVVAAVVGAAACGGGEKTEASDAGAASAESKQPTLGGKLGAAVAAAEASARSQRGPGGARTPNGAASANAGGDGPPESGVFPPGRADHDAPPNAAPKVELFGDGTEPRLQLAYDKFDDQKMALSVSVRVGPQSVLPSVDLDLEVRADKKGDKKDKKDDGKKDKKDKKDDGKKDKPAEPEAEGAKLAMKVANATLSKEQLGNVPKEVGEAIGKLKGSELRFVLTPDGRVANMGAALGKDAAAELEVVLRSLGESMSIAIAPLPKKPVGVGGYWMVSDRTMTSRGMDVVRYRVFKVEKVDGQKAILSVDTREYAAAGALDFGAKGKATIERFESQGKSSISMSGGLPVPLEMTQRMQALVGAPGGKEQGQQPQGIFFQFDTKSR
jgi:hypothetical protein